VSETATPPAALHEADATAARQVDSDVLLMCGLAWGAGLIHIQAAIDHLSEVPAYAVCFVVLTVAQIAWGIALYRSPRRGLLIAGAIGSLCVLAVWILSRTTGLPIGPQRGETEQLGLLDGVASADEVALIVLVAFRLSARPLHGGRTIGWLVFGAVGALVLLSSMVLAGGVHAH
jgi:hypothetical protein